VIANHEFPAGSELLAVGRSMTGRGASGAALTVAVLDGPANTRELTYETKETP